jgi:WhiB family redox-sensing transcriptional regulator
VPDDPATPATSEHLPATLLAVAAADTRRKWSARGHCAEKDPELFFPPRDGSTEEAKAICSSCVVRRQCLAYAVVAEEPYGIWGGLDPGERHNLRRRLQRASGSAANAARGER